MGPSFQDLREQFEGGISPVRQEKVPFSERVQMEKGQFPLAGLERRQTGIENEGVSHIEQNGEAGVGRSGKRCVHTGNEHLHRSSGNGAIDH